jgi:hypothetical protein
VDRIQLVEVPSEDYVTLNYFGLAGTDLPQVSAVNSVDDTVVDCVLFIVGCLLLCVFDSVDCNGHDGRQRSQAI